MALVVGVHGIAQEDSTAQRQVRLWSEALGLGIVAAGGGVLEVPSMAVPFYGSLFRKGSPFLGVEDEDVWDEGEAEFVADVLDDFVLTLPEDEVADLAAALGELGPPALVPPRLLRGLAAVDRRFGRGRSRLLRRLLRQVYAYLYREDTAAEVRRIVLADVIEDSRMLVGHSLGSVVAYDLVRRGLAPRVAAVVTLGSPLAWPRVRRALDAAASVADMGRGESWSNVFDPWDVVTAGQGLAPRAVDYPVDNGRGDPHGLVRYLSQAKTGEVILAMARSAGRGR